MSDPEMNNRKDAPAYLYIYLRFELSFGKQVILGKKRPQLHAASRRRDPDKKKRKKKKKGKRKERGKTRAIPLRCTRAGYTSYIPLRIHTYLVPKS